MTAVQGHYVSKEFCTLEVEEEREEAEAIRTASYMQSL